MTRLGKKNSDEWKEIMKRKLRRGTFLNCIVCHKDYYCKKKNLHTSKYCSRKCQGKRLSNLEFRDKQLKSVIGNTFRKGKKSPKISGKNHWNWQSGLTSINSKIRNSLEMKLWRQSVLERDNHACVWCSSNKDLVADHIKPFSLYPELRFAIDNGRTLCNSCHLKTDTFAGRIKK